MTRKGGNVQQSDLMMMMQAERKPEGIPLAF